MMYLLIAVALPGQANAFYCSHTRCDLKYFSSRTECEIQAIHEPVIDKVLLRCIPVHRRQDPY